MENKIEKLNELGELYKSGAITIEEFESLKAEILSGSMIISENESESKSSTIKKKVDEEKISLKSFTDNQGNIINPPNLEYLNLKDVTDKELELLKPFVRSKQIYAPFEMTEDEMKICNKFFSIQEIAEMNSERPGFNHAFISIVSVLGAAFSLFITSHSPCLLIFGSSILIGSIFFSFFTLTRADATKLDKGVSYIALIINIITIFLIITWKT